MRCPTRHPERLLIRTRPNDERPATLQSPAVRVGLSLTSIHEALMRHPFTFVVMLSIAAACAGGSKASAPDSGSNVISQSELDAAGPVSAYDAVQRLRPSYLRGRGPTSVMNAAARTRPAVFVDATEYGEVESLRTFPASRVQTIRYYSGPEAVTKFGSTYGAGVIQLTMRTQ
jgi:hypothetical protein